MQNDNEKYLGWAAVVLGIVMFVVFFGKEVILDKVTDHVADKVVIKLQKSYSPSPYGPGLDPDKIDVKKISQ
jgi:hypothetical protein